MLTTPRRQLMPIHADDRYEFDTPSRRRKRGGTRHTRYRRRHAGVDTEIRLLDARRYIFD